MFPVFVDFENRLVISWHSISISGDNYIPLHLRAFLWRQVTFYSKIHCLILFHSRTCISNLKAVVYDGPKPLAIESSWYNDPFICFGYFSSTELRTR